jgi:hypothetical protein
VIAARRAPGLSYVAIPPATDRTLLRSDVAGFFGATRRGPVGERVRVEGWRGYLAAFGAFADTVDVGGARRRLLTPHALRGYFDNGGEIAHVVRIAGPGARAATAVWWVGLHDGTGRWLPGFPAANGFAAGAYRVNASSPGAWANAGQVQLRYRRHGSTGAAEVDVTVSIPGEPDEHLTRIDPASLVSEVERRSNLIRLEPIVDAGLEPLPAFDRARPGPNAYDRALTLAGGTDGFDVAQQGDLDAACFAYLHAHQNAVQSLNDEPEIALVAAPDLYRDGVLDFIHARADGGSGIDRAREETIDALLAGAAGQQDRLVLLDAPSASMTTPDLVALGSRLRAQTLGPLPDDPSELPPDAEDETIARAAALYHPWLLVQDPLGDVAQPLLAVPPSGHVAGVVSRLDRERGPHHTPANAPVAEAFDGSVRLEDEEQAILNPLGVNLIRCFPGRGLQFWGGRTLDLGQGKFVAHRRLVHRLVRAIRAVAEPLVFDVNGPELWLALVRGISTVLLEAYRAGALQGERPEEAFTVKCDAETNPSQEQDQGRCVCEIQLAPARPMEFIDLRVALLQNGAFEVLE